MLSFYKNKDGVTEWRKEKKKTNNGKPTPKNKISFRCFLFSQKERDIKSEQIYTPTCMIDSSLYIVFHDLCKESEL